MQDKKYRIIALITRKDLIGYGAKITLCEGPFSHNEACTVLSKITKYNWREEQLEEI